MCKRLLAVRIFRLFAFFLFLLFFFVLLLSEEAVEDSEDDDEEEELDDESEKEESSEEEEDDSEEEDLPLFLPFTVFFRSVFFLVDNTVLELFFSFALCVPSTPAWVSLP